MKASERAEIGKTGVVVTRLGLGGTALSGTLFGATDARPTPMDEALAMIRSCVRAGVHYFDTAPMYGLGESERRYGAALAGVERGRFAISTKVGRVLTPGKESAEEWEFDFSRAGVKNSLSSSLQRLGLSHVDIAYIHDPDGDIMFPTGDRDYYDEALRNALPALKDLREAGTVRAIGVGMNQWEMELRFAREGDFDCFLLAGRYTLLDQSALDKFLPYCSDHQISVIIGGPYNSGILALEGRPGATYNYTKAPPEVVSKVTRISDVCLNYHIPLKAAALQFILAHPAVVSVIPGARSVAEIEENMKMVELPIPTAMWDELRQMGLIHPDAPTPSSL